MITRDNRGFLNTVMGILIAVAIIGVFPFVAIADAKYKDNLNTDIAVAEKMLMPRPLSISTGTARFNLDENTQLCSSTQTRPAAELLAEILRKSTGFPLPITTCRGTEPQGKLISLLASSAPQVEDDDPVLESYELKVSENKVEIIAPTLQGSIWGVQSLLQLLGPWSRASEPVNYEWSVPAVNIKDQPRSHWRGLLIDPARSFIPVAEVKDIIDSLSAYKLNRLHIHLNDDQGWRIEIPNPSVNKAGIDYSLLTKVGANLRQAPPLPKLNNQPLKEGYYTLAEYRELVEYAANRGVEVVPEIDGPGHAAAILSSIPQLNGNYSFPRLAPGEKVLKNYHVSQGFSSLDPTKEETYQFLDHVIGTIAAEHNQVTLRPKQKKYFHVGLDESANTTLEHQKLYREKLYKILQTKGLKGIQYNDMENDKYFSQKPAEYPESIRQFWHLPNYFKTPLGKDLLAKQGKVIYSGASITYFPQRQGTDIPGSWWACIGKTDYKCDVFSTYNFKNQAQNLPEENFYGIEGAMWGETVRTSQDRDMMMYPRLLALAEVGWTPDRLRKQADFANRLTLQEMSLNIMGIDFYTHSWRSQHGFIPRKDIPLNAADTTLGYLAVPGVKTAEVKVSLTWKGNNIPLKLHRVKDFNYGEVFNDYPYLLEQNYRADGQISNRSSGSLIRVVAPRGIPSLEAVLTLESPQIRLENKLTAAGNIDYLLKESDSTLALPQYQGHLPENNEKIIFIGKGGLLFQDVAVGAPFYKDIYWLRSKGITTGYADGTFRPKDPIERAAVIAFLYRLAGSPKVDLSGAPTFKDVPPNHDFYKEIVWARQNGVTTGWSDGTFRPHAHIERAAMVAFLERYCNKLKAIPGNYRVQIERVQKFKDVPRDDYFFEKVAWAAQLGITTGWSDGTFRPTEAISREAMAAFIHRMVDYGKTHP